MSKQLIVTEIGEQNIMKIYEDDKLIKEINHVEIGKNGISENAYEGSVKTPLGLFNLGVSFGTHDLSINYPYFKITDNDYWVDDAKSPNYNKMIRINYPVNTFNYPYIKSQQQKNFNSAEHLIDYSKQYEYAVYIEYNVDREKNSDGKGKGSAIFLHCLGDKGYTGGCVAIPKEEMYFILTFLDKNKNPQILIKIKD